MKISLNWLTDYVNLAAASGGEVLAAQELAERLLNAGLACEEIVETEADIVLDIEVTSNRPDCLGYLGVAREVAAITGAAFQPPKIPDLPVHGKVEKLAAVEVCEPALCPRYTARVIRGVKVAPSPRWLVERLEAVGLRSVNNVVDVTNYVLMEYSQPLHSFDYDKLAGHRIVVRRARDGETLTAIDGTKCRLDGEMLVIADAEKPVAIAGVMGGLDSEVGGETVNVLIESARFDPLSVRRTARGLQLMSESNYRFERGVDPVGVEQASRRACQLILELAGGQLAAGVVDVWAEPYKAPNVALRPERTDALLGFSVPINRQEEILRRLGLSPRRKAGKIICTIPSHRADLSREVDLIEEIARLEGLEKVPTAETFTISVAAEAAPQRLRRQAGELLAAAGFDEAMTFAFIDSAEAALFGCPKPLTVKERVRKTQNALRPTLLPNLLRACKTNQDAGHGDVSLFELASVFPPGEGELPDERVELAMVTCGPLEDLRGAVEILVARLAPDGRLETVAAELTGFEPQAAAEIHLDGAPVGRIGCVADAVRNYYSLERSVTAATLQFNALLRGSGKRRTYRPLPRFPAVQRDLSLVVDEAVTWRQLADAVAQVPQPLRVALEYVTTYRGRPVPAGRKSVTATMTYRSPDGTLRKEQVDQQVAQVVASLKKVFSAELRA